MPIIQSPVTFRENVRDELNRIFTEPTLTTNVEIGIYNFAIKEATGRKIVKKWDNPHFVQLYLDRFRSLYNNLHVALPTPASSSTTPSVLLSLIKNGEITPTQLAHMTHQEMNPERWKELIDRKIQRDTAKYTVNIEASTDMYTCRKCRSTRCTYYELQTRSADEPMTIFITCLDCGKRWKN